MFLRNSFFLWKRSNYHFVQSTATIHYQTKRVKNGPDLASLPCTIISKQLFLHGNEKELICFVPSKQFSSIWISPRSQRIFYLQFSKKALYKGNNEFFIWFSDLLNRLLILNLILWCNIFQKCAVLSLINIFEVAAIAILKCKQHGAVHLNSFCYAFIFLMDYDRIFLVIHLIFTFHAPILIQIYQSNFLYLLSKEE